MTQRSALSEMGQMVLVTGGFLGYSGPSQQEEVVLMMVHASAWISSRRTFAQQNQQPLFYQRQQNAV